MILQFFIGRYEKLQDYKQRFLDWHVLRGITNNKRAVKNHFSPPYLKTFYWKILQGKYKMPSCKGQACES